MRLFVLQPYLTLICKSWKTHPEIFLKFSFSGSSHRPFYWKTHPDNFSKFQFWGVTQAVLLENSSIKNHGYLFSFFNFGASPRPFSWKTHPFKLWLKSYTGRFTVLSVVDYQLLNSFLLRKEIRPSPEKPDYRNFLLKVAQGFCANSLKCSVAPLKVRNRSFSRSKCKSCHDIDPYKDSRTSKFCDRCNSATCSNHAKTLSRQCFAS